VPALVKGTRF